MAIGKFETADAAKPATPTAAAPKGGAAKKKKR
jgi:hypothetical protein